MYDLKPHTVEASLEAMNVKTSRSDASLTIVLAEDVPPQVWKNARLIRGD